MNNDGTLSLVNSTLSNNTTNVISPMGGASRKGGGLYTTGPTTISNSTITNNTTGNGSSFTGPIFNGSGSGQGGGIYSTAPLTIANSTLLNNGTGNGGNGNSPTVPSVNGGAGGSAGQGGAIYSTDTLWLSNSLVQNNSTGSGGNGGNGIVFITANGTGGAGGSGGDGGGIYSSGALTISNSAIVSNTVGNGGDGGDGYSTAADGDGGNSGDGTGIYSSGSLDMSGSTLAYNQTGSGGDASDATPGRGGYGGGLYSAGTADLSNNTLSGNSVGSAGSNASATGGDHGTGAGIFNQGQLTLAFSTLAYNTTISANTVLTAAAANLSNDTAGTLTMANTILAYGDVDADCGNDGTLTDNGYNLVEDNTCISAGTSLSGDPLLLSLADNGGDTETHALDTGSPAIDVIPNGTAGCGTTYTTDQRGEARPNAGSCDIGAYELYCAGSPYAVSDDAGLEVAINCYNTTTTGQTVINFTDDITLTNSLPNIDNSAGADLYIQGNGYSLDGDDTYLVMRMDNGLTTLDTLTVTNGYQSAINSTGAGIYIGSGVFTITNSAIINNSALGNGGGIYAAGGVSLTVQNSEVTYNETRYVTTKSGGGIYLGNGAVVTVTNSLIHDNYSAYLGGGIHNQKGMLIVVDSAIYDNTGRNGGGAITNYGGETHISNSTISGNDRSNGTGGDGLVIYSTSSDDAYTYLTHTSVISNNESSIYSINLSSGSKSYLYLYNSLVAGGTSENCGDNATGTFVIQGSYSLDDDGTCVSDGVDGNVVADPQVETLQDNGGDTLTHALTEDSPAIDQIPLGTNGCGTTYATDQRGESRPLNYSCDMGAYEFDYCLNRSLYEAADESDLNRAIECYNAATSGSKVISLTADITLLTSTTTIENANDVGLSIAGNGLTIDGGDQGRPLRISGVEVDISDITLTNGRIEDDNGGGLYVSGGSVFTLTNSTISNNVAGSAAGIYLSNSQGRIEQTVISGNDAVNFGGGGILARDGSQVEIVDTAILSNTAPNIAGGLRSTVNAVITLTNSTIAYNQAITDAGGINANLNSTINLINSTVSENLAGRYGGGIYARGTMNISYTTVASNTSTTGGGIYTNGGSPVVLA